MFEIDWVRLLHPLMEKPWGVVDSETSLHTFDDGLDGLPDDPPQDDANNTAVNPKHNRIFRIATFSWFYPGRTATCVETHEVSGTLRMTLAQLPDGSFTGDAMTTTLETIVAGCSTSVLGAAGSRNWSLPVTGRAQTLAFNGQAMSTFAFLSGGTIARLTTLTFSGALASGVVTGTMTLTRTGQGMTDPTSTTPASPVVESGTASLSVTLR